MATKRRSKPARKPSPLSRGERATLSRILKKARAAKAYYKTLKKKA